MDANAGALRSRKKQMQRFRDALKQCIREEDSLELYRLRNLLGGEKKISRAERNRWSLYLTDFHQRFGQIDRFAFGKSSPMKPLVLAMDYLARRSLGASAKEARWLTAKAWNSTEAAVKDGLTKRREEAEISIDMFIMTRWSRNLTAGKQPARSESREQSLKAFLSGLPKRYSPGSL